MGIIWALIFVGFLTATPGRADENKLSPPQTILSSTTISGYVDIAISYSNTQSNTLALLDDAEHFHWSGIAGQVLLVSSTNHTRKSFACQSTLCVYALSRGPISLVGQFTTAEDGTFVVRLPHGTYAIVPFLPRLELSLSSCPVVFKVSDRRITPININVIEGRKPTSGKSDGGNFYGFEASRMEWKHPGSKVPTVLPPTPILPISNNDQ